MKTEHQRYRYIHVLGSITHKGQKVAATRVSVSGRMEIYMRYLHAMEYSLKEKQILTLATKWMTLNGIMLSEISQSRKVNSVCFHS